MASSLYEDAEDGFFGEESISQTYSVEEEEEEEEEDDEKDRVRLRKGKRPAESQSVESFYGEDSQSNDSQIVQRFNDASKRRKKVATSEVHLSSSNNKEEQKEEDSSEEEDDDDVRQDQEKSLTNVIQWLDSVAGEEKTRKAKKRKADEEEEESGRSKRLKSLDASDAFPIFDDEGGWSFLPDREDQEEPAFGEFDEDDNNVQSFADILAEKPPSEGNGGKKRKRAAKKKKTVYSLQHYYPEINYDFTRFRFRPLLKPGKQVNDVPFKFLAIGADWRYDKKLGTCIHVYGNLWGTNHSTLAVLKGFRPHIFLSILPEWKKTALSSKDGDDDIRSRYDLSKIESFVSELDTVLRTEFPWPKWDKEKVDSMPRVVLRYEIRKAVDMEDYIAKDPKHPRPENFWDLPDSEKAKCTGVTQKVEDHLQVFCCFPRAIPAVRYVVSNASLYSWTHAELNDGSEKNRMQTLEGDVDFTVRFMTDMHFSPSEWYEIGELRYEIRQRGAFGRASKADWEVVCDYREMRPTPNPKDNDTLCNFQICTFDGEMLGKPGKFPKAEKGDPVVLCTLCLTSYMDRKTMVYVLLSIGLKAEVIEDKEKSTYTYVFTKEMSLLKAFYDFIEQVDVDIFQTYNGDNFDWPYFLSRGTHFFGESFARVGRSVWNKVIVKKKAWRNKTIYSLAGLTGRTNIDIYKRMKDGIPGVKFNDFRLSTVSNALLGESKNEFNVKLMHMKVRNEEGLKELREYGKQDSILPEKISSHGKVNTIPTYVSLSRVTNQFFQQCLDRAVGSKIEGRLRKVCFMDDQKPTVKRCKLIPDKHGRGPGYRMGDDDFEDDLVDKCEGKHKGATVITPMVGFHKDPVGVLDFKSMYPSIMLLLNLCMTTLVNARMIKLLGLTENDYFRLPKYEIKDDEIVLKYDPDAPCFIRRELLQGVLPKVEEDLWKMRDKVKGEMKSAKSMKTVLEGQVKDALAQIAELKSRSSGLCRKKVEELENSCKLLRKKIMDIEFQIVLLDGQQAGIKVWMNGIFGQTIYKSSKYFKEEIGETILTFGRFLINYVKLLVNIEYPKKHPDIQYKPVVVYGDTDSNMIKLEGFKGDLKEAVVEFKRIASFVNSYFVNCKPLDMQFEKMYDGLILVSGKNYIGLIVWVEEVWLTKIETKGARYIKKGPPQCFKKDCEKAAEIFLKEKNLEKALDVIRDRVIQLKKRRVTVSDLVYTHTYNKDPSYPLWSYCKRLEQEGIDVPGPVRKAIERRYKKSVDYKKKGKKKCVINASVVHTYKLLCEDPGVWFERGDSIFFLYHDEERRVNKSRRGFVKKEMRLMTADPLVMIEKDIPYDVERYIEDLIKLSQKVLALPLGDTEVDKCPRFRDAILKHPRVAGVKIKKYQSFKSSEVGSTFVRQEDKQGKITSYYSSVVIGICVMCHRKLAEGESALELKSGVNNKMLCNKCSKSVDLTHYESYLKEKIESEKRDNDAAWKKCRITLGSDTLNPRECIDFTCSNNSHRMDTEKKLKSTEELLAKLAAFKDDRFKRDMEYYGQI